jgi:heptosyltransferase-2
VEALLAAAGVAAHEALVALAPGSVWATKRWPSYDALGASIARSPALRGTRVVVVGGAADAPLAAAIGTAVREAGGPPVVDTTGALSLLESAALLARARALVTNDSAPLHLASAMNTPTLALFGPTVPAFGFGPLADARTSLGHETLGCRPCDAHGPQACPLGHWRCMRELDVARVQAALVTLAPPAR